MFFLYFLCIFFYVFSCFFIVSLRFFAVLAVLARFLFSFFFLYLKGSAAAADPLVGQVPLGGDMTLRWGDMTLQGKILEGQNWGPWGVSGPGTFKKTFPREK